MKNTTTTIRKDFEAIKRDFETAYASGNDYTKELTALATVFAFSVVNKCLDPQRKSATERETVSDNGYSPALRELRAGIRADLNALENLRDNTNRATVNRFTADGDMETITADADALEAVNTLLGECLTEGIDLVQEAILAILEQAQEHASGETWLDMPYTVTRLSKRVLIREKGDTVAYKDDTTTPAREIFRAVRRLVQKSRAVQTDPRNGYSYIEDFATDEHGGMEVIFHRLQKYADLGGNDCNGNYTVTEGSALEYYTVLERLHLTEKQAKIVSLRVRGYGYKAIATATGTREDNVKLILKRIREKCVEMGFTREAYAELHREQMSDRELYLLYR